MKNIRNFLDGNKIYAEINREERNLAAILYHVLLLKDNLQRFLTLIDCSFEVNNAEMGIYFEYAYVRDLWFNIGDNNDKKQSLICKYLDLKNTVEISKKSVPQFNTYFGAVPTPSKKYIQSPGQWSLQKYNANIKDDYDFLKVCMFKWAFKAKPDIVIHTSKDQAICIEAKLESPESFYPQDSEEKNIFDNRVKRVSQTALRIDSPCKHVSKTRVSQTALQIYLMEKMLGIETNFVLIHNSGIKDVCKKYKSLSWDYIFKELNIEQIPDFMKTTIDSIKQIA